MKLIKKAIVYDWDGTLINSVPTAFRATEIIFERYGCKPPTFETYVATFGPPYTQFYWDNGLPISVSDAEIWAQYMSASKFEDAPLFKDVYETICLQRSYGYKIGLVSGQRKKVLNALMQKYKCTGLFDCIFCEVSPDKVQSFRSACDALSVLPEQAYSIGDFATDIRDSKIVGLEPIGIIRNGHDLSHVLIKAGAKQVIRELSELQLFES